MKKEGKKEEKRASVLTVYYSPFGCLICLSFSYSRDVVKDR